MDKTDTKYLKIYGIQRTCTSHVTNLVIKNIENIDGCNNEIGGKHHPVKNAEEIKEALDKIMEKSDKDSNPYKKAFKIKIDLFNKNKVVHPLIVIKNPYSWYFSISRWVPLYNKVFNINTWYKRFNDFYKNWKDLLETPHKPFDKGMVVTYEKLLINQPAFLYELQNNFGCILKPKITISDRMASAKNVSTEKTIFDEGRKKFYLQSGDFGLSKDIKKQINELVDWELMEYYGYRKIN